MAETDARAGAKADQPVHESKEVLYAVVEFARDELPLQAYDLFNVNVGEGAIPAYDLPAFVQFR